MRREEITTIVTSDLGGQTRGKGYPARDRESRLKRGIGWTPTNSMITPLGPIAPSLAKAVPNGAEVSLFLPVCRPQAGR